MTVVIYKATSDGISAELLKIGGYMLAEYLHVEMQKVWSEKVLPPEWNISAICPIFKKSDVKNAQTKEASHTRK